MSPVAEGLGMWKPSMYAGAATHLAGSSGAAACLLPRSSEWLLLHATFSEDKYLSPPLSNGTALSNPVFTLPNANLNRHHEDSRNRTHASAVSPYLTEQNSRHGVTFLQDASGCYSIGFPKSRHTARDTGRREDQALKDLRAFRIRLETEPMKGKLRE